MCYKKQIDCVIIWLLFELRVKFKSSFLGYEVGVLGWVCEVKIEKGQFAVSNYTVPVIDVTIICYWLLSYFSY